jgi:hypothetical protein
MNASVVPEPGRPPRPSLVAALTSTLPPVNGQVTEKDAIKLKVVRFQARPMIGRFVQELDEILCRFDEIIGAWDRNYILDLNEIAFGDYVPELKEDHTDDQNDLTSSQGSEWSRGTSNFSWGNSQNPSKTATPQIGTPRSNEI